MSRIVCYTLDFKEKYKTFNNLEELTTELIGVKDQAEKALDNVSLSYRGYRLISEDKLDTTLSQVVNSVDKKLKDDYINAITELETKIKKLEKNERKTIVKIEALNDDNESKIEEIKNNHKAELESLKTNYESNLNDLKVNHDSKIKNLNIVFNKEKSELLAKQEQDTSDLTAKYETKIIELNSKYEQLTESLKLEIENYIKNTTKLTEDYNKKVQLKEIEYQEKINILLNNKEIAQNNLKLKLVATMNQVNSLIVVLNTILKNEASTLGTSASTLDLLDVMKIKKLSNSIRDYSDMKIVNPLAEKLNPLQFKQTTPDFSEIKATSKTSNEPEVKEKPKQTEQKDVTIIIKKEPKKLVVNGLKLLSVPEFESLTVDKKASYIYSLTEKQITLDDIDGYYPTLPSDLKNEILIKNILETTHRNGKKYKYIQSIVPREIAEELFSTIAKTKIEFNNFFNILPKPEVNNTPKNELVTDKTSSSPENIEETSLSSENIPVVFDWVRFKEKYLKTEYTQLMFKKDALTIKDACNLSEIPLIQLKNMLGLLQNLGYTREFKNESLLSKDEVLFLIVTDGWAKSNKKIKRQAGDNLRVMMEQLYPSWLKYTKENK